MGHYLSGPSVCGFYGAFDEDYGSADTPLPYPRVTPSKIATALLPFNCPACDQPIDFSDPKRREHFHDTRTISNADGSTTKRDNYWCPTCSSRFLLNPVGTPYDGTIVDGVAPSTVETVSIGADGFVDFKRTKKTPGKTMLDGFSSIMGHLGNYVHGTDVLGCP